MQVAVASVAEVLELEVIVFGQLVGKHHIVGDLGHRHHHVALVQQLGLLLDALQEMCIRDRCYLGGFTFFGDYAQAAALTLSYLL